MSRHGDKHSLVIAGHATSITLEPEFWAALKTIAAERHLSLAALVAEIDGRRTLVDASRPSISTPARNLSSVLRVFVLAHYIHAAAAFDFAAEATSG